jgi:type IV secretory pathway VirB9-like protein
MKRVFLATALAASILAPASASNDSANWQTIRYGSKVQADITCSAGVICEVSLARGETLRGGQFVGSTLINGVNTGGYELWQHSSFTEGVQTDRGTEYRPHLTFIASRPGITASAVVSTDQHMYRFMIRSDSAARPSYYGFYYPSRFQPRAVTARYVAYEKPAPPLPMDTQSQMNRACAAMSGREQYALDAKPVELHPLRVCHDQRRTFIQLQPSDTVPTDIAIPREVTSQGDANVVWTYDSSSRIYGIDLVPDNLVLTLGDGRRQTRMRIQRQVVTTVPITAIKSGR